MSNVNTVISWIEKETGLAHNNDWTSEQDLLQSGLLNSMKLMKLLMVIEDLCGGELDESKLNFEMLRSVEKIKQWYL